jgi:hypothetical protein
MNNFDHSKNSVLFFSICLLSVTVGLSLGGFVDAIIRKWQHDDDDWRQRRYIRSLGFFFAQATLNIALLLAFVKSTQSFVPWLQLSVSGALFSVLLFTSQRNLVDNVLNLTNF